MMDDECYLITGGAGFIGSNLAGSLLDKDSNIRIIILDNLSTGKPENIPDDRRIKFLHGDVTDKNLLDRIFNKYEFNYIFHLAAVSSVQESIIKPYPAHKVNFDSVLMLLEKARPLKYLRRFLFTSSAAVYGNEPDIPCRESDPVNPISPYGVDKFAAEKYVRNSFSLYGIPATAVRLFNVYGPGQVSSSRYSGIISILLDGFLNNKEPVDILGDGNQTRDFIFVKDAVQIMIDLSLLAESRGEVYNIGTGIETSLLKLIDILQKIFGKDIPVELKPERKGDIRRSAADNCKLLKAVKSFTFTDLLKGLKYFL